MRIRRDSKRLLAASLLIGLCGYAQAQQGYPSRPMRFIIPNAPGGSNSFVARMVADEMTKSWGQSVVVDNRGGGDGVIAYQALYRSAPDGHTMLLGTAALTIRPALHPNKVYDAYVKEFVPLTTLVRTDYIMVLHQSVPATTVKFVYAKGHSYLTNDPAACANCHIMREHFEGWMKSPHRHVAVCNDCHTPHDPVRKNAVKASNVFWHSLGFTTGRFPDPLRIKAGNHQVTEAACRRCHAPVETAMDAFHGEKSTISCVRCHANVGHLRE